MIKLRMRQPDAVPAVVPDSAPAPPPSPPPNTDEPKPTRRLVRAAAQVKRPFLLPTVVLCGGFVSAAVWSKHPLPSSQNITTGRVVLGVTILLLAAEIARRRPHFSRPQLPALLVLAGLVAGVAIIGANAAAHGTLRSAGSFTGYSEFVVIVLVVALLTTLSPRAGLALLLSAAVGGTLAAIFALSGVQGAPFGGTSRLIGAYGNPNYLAFAASLTLAALLGAARFVPWRVRIALGILALPVTACLILTFSRSGLIQGVVALVAAAALIPSTRRARLGVVAIMGVVLALAAVTLYPIYQRARLRADFSSEIKGGLPDRSGWDPSAEGFIIGGSRLRNSTSGVLEVVAHQSSQGVSHRVGLVLPSQVLRLSLWLRTGGSTRPLEVALEDNLAGNGPASRQVLVSEKWRHLRVVWRPSAPSPHARFYVKALSPGTTLFVRNVAVAKGPPKVAAKQAFRGTALSTRLLGAPTAQHAFSGLEANFIKSRLAAARLSWRLFIHHPLFGVGWQRYSRYAARDIAPALNAQSTHDDYLRMLAELGIPGLLFLLTVIIGVLVRLRRAKFVVPQRASLPILAAGAVGIFFITALETPAISLALAAAVGMICCTIAAAEDEGLNRPE